MNSITTRNKKRVQTQSQSSL